MNNYRRFACLILGMELLLAVFCNGFYFVKAEGADSRIYRVEAARVAEELRGKAPDAIDLSGYSSIVKVSPFRADESCSRDYVVESVNGSLYRIEYVSTRSRLPLAAMELALSVMLSVSAVLLYMGQKKILQPFHEMNRLSAELAKGNLAVPLKADKSRFFGGFLWGLDMLRENLEQKRRGELALMREKKTLILSLSHDIKTPLSAIDLYTRALAEGLYDTKEKERKALGGIAKNVDEIKRYVNEIAQASREDFLNLEIRQGEFYLAEILDAIQSYYREKLALRHTEFSVEKSSDGLLAGDRERVIEVLQNVMENAVKYGDGRWIRISCGEEEDCILIRVENTGCSLAGEELPHLFESFYRGSNSANVPGSGLGLYIAQNLMRKMDGEVFAEADGGCFAVTVVVRKA